MNANTRIVIGMLLLALTSCGASQTAELAPKNPSATVPTAVAAAPHVLTPAAAPANAAATEPTTMVMPAASASTNASATTQPATPPPKSLRDYQQILGRACQSDTDCVVKNVGSCCGYQPQCVHKDVPTFPEQVKALCEKEGRSSICGFQEPAGCSCVNHQCRDRASAGI